MNLSDIFEKNEWEYRKHLFEEAICGDVQLILANNTVSIKYPSTTISTSSDFQISITPYFEQKKVLSLAHNHKYTISEITQKLSKIKINQEKIINVYNYLSFILKDEKHPEYVYICSNIDYLNFNPKMFSEKIHKETENLIKNYGQLFSKIQKYIWEDSIEQFVPPGFLISTYNQFCRKYRDRKYTSGDILDTFTFLPFMNQKDNDFYKKVVLKEDPFQKPYHEILDLISKMDEILKNY